MSENAGLTELLVPVAGIALGGTLASGLGASVSPYLAGVLWIIAWLVFTFGLWVRVVPTDRLKRAKAVWGVAVVSILSAGLGVWLWQETSKHSDIRMSGKPQLDEDGTVSYHVEYHNEEGQWPAEISIAWRGYEGVPYAVVRDPERQRQFEDRVAGQIAGLRSEVWESFPEDARGDYRGRVIFPSKQDRDDFDSRKLGILVFSEIRYRDWRFGTRRRTLCRYMVMNVDETISEIRCLSHNR